MSDIGGHDTARRRRRMILVVLLGALGAWQMGAGGYIHAKALLAQYLLERAWHESLDGRLQAKPWPWADTWPVARLRAPRQGVDLIVLAGASGRTLAFAPGHLDGTPLPGQPGNIVISGHRDTDFRFLKDLHRGDPLILEGRNGREYRYRVTAMQVMDSRRARLPEPAMGSMLTLVTCYPFDAVVPGGPLRYVVMARAVNAIGSN